MEPVKRSAARYRVYLSVRYEESVDFVREYAENLSRGGMFIRGARGLARHRDVMVEIELPGFGLYQVRAEVMHVITDEMAREHGRSAGAGLALRETPDGFEEALSGYLVRLGRRGDSIVLAADEEAARLLHAAGYQVQPLESAEALAKMRLPPRAAPVSETDTDPGVPAEQAAAVIGVVVPDARLGEFRRAARTTSVRELLVPMEGPEQIDEVLMRLDQRL